MQTDAYWAHIDKHKGDRLKGGVNIPVLESLPICVPPIEEQQRFVSLMDSLEEKVSLLRRTRGLVDDLSRSILRNIVNSDASSTGNGARSEQI